MNKDTFFPSRILQFLLTLLLVMVIDSPIILLLKDIDAGIQQTLFFVVFCLSFLFAIALINYRKKNKVFSFYTKSLDSLWFALIIVFIIQCLISQPLSALLDNKSTIIESNLYTIIGSVYF